MSQTPQEPSPSGTPAPEIIPQPAAPRSSAHTPVKRVNPASTIRENKTVDSRPPEHRRDFFSEAMREALIPFAGMLERKINPILAALEAIPDEVDRFTNQMQPARPALDQPQSRQIADPPDRTHEAPRILRPPGALPPIQFESRCSSCGKCVEACPANAISIDRQTLIGDGKPYIIASTQPCVVCSSLACMNVCPTGALKLTDRLKIKMGTARVNLDLCRREEGEDCRLCLDACPIMGEGAGPAGDALAIHAGTDHVLVRRNACVGCGLCENRCPTEPAAIVIQPYVPPKDPIIA